MILFAFDRDSTVDSSPSPGPVPLAWVRWLAKHYPVWAIGNPALGPEAGIPTHRDIAKRLRADPQHAARLSGARAAFSGLPAREVNVKSKVFRLAGLDRLVPDPTIRIVVDDFAIPVESHWIYMTPEDFVEAWRPLLCHIGT